MEKQAGLFEHYCMHPGCKSWVRSALTRAVGWTGIVQNINRMPVKAKISSVLSQLHPIV
jgi:hypothetical protein